MDWWVCESFQLKGGNKLGHSVKRLRATAAYCKKIELCIIVSEIDTHIK